MSLVQEIRIAALEGLAIPENVTVGSTLEITCRLHIADIHQDWVDVTTSVGKPEQLPGNVTLSTVAIEWTAT